MNKLHRLLLAGTIISGVVSLREADAGVANSDQTKREGRLTQGRVELAQAVNKRGRVTPSLPNGSTA